VVAGTIGNTMEDNYFDAYPDNREQTEEFWVHHVIKDFDYIFSSGKFPDSLYELLSEETKTKLFTLAANKIYERTINGNGY